MAISFKKYSGIYLLEARQELNINIEEAWKFFSSPLNLEKITPKEMGFSITNEINNKAYSGQIITYKVGVFPLIKSNWVTEITHIKERAFFVDEQRFGPYRMWHHEHHFTPTDTGVLMEDKIHFKLPFGFFGHLAYLFFVKRKLEKIFNHRERAIAQFFQ